MASRILLISDLHLEESRPDITAALLAFLAANTACCDALYILGDLFEVWIGDDEQTELGDTVATALKQFSAAGTSVWLMHGNRDFMLGSSYASRCGASLIDDPAVIETDSGSALLLHGDSLCIDDIDYMQFRRRVRGASWQQEFLAKSLEDRRAFAQSAREQSRLATSAKESSIMDVNQAEVQKRLAASAQTTLIHGHTHRPAVHEVVLERPIDGQSLAQRVVLGDWDQSPWYAEITKAGVKLENFPFPA
ncbi:MAG: UDP-2,3-diacylglucosamine diphosphatase [Pseudohongiella sp.]|nr:UDP-2,3-diacylglucosamine diphosphatase [Pseudohongiella sp.]